jgi:hypothetical protein
LIAILRETCVIGRGVTIILYTPLRASATVVNHGIPQLHYRRTPPETPLRILAKHPYSCICGSMKTTIDLPDDVFLKAKILAAERSMTFKDLVVQGLKLVTEASAEADEKKRKAELKRLLKAMRASNTEPMVPLSRKEIHDR